MPKKREERQIRAAHRKHKKTQKWNPRSTEDEDEEGDFLSLRNQLELLGLTLREIPGDGNCLFRALSDQLTGSSDSHITYRKNVVDYIRDHREDFEPFIEDDIPFERHLSMLAKDGTFAGNDSIVAFARLQNATIVIHQLNRPLWQIHGSKDGCTPCQTELHISYHNGDHYNSVRLMNEPKHIRKPANIKIKVIKTMRDINENSNHQKSIEVHEDKATLEDTEENLSDYENVTQDELKIKRVMTLSGASDETKALKALQMNDFFVDAAVNSLLQSSNAMSGHPSLWQSGGTGNRIFGSEASREALKQEKEGPKLSQAEKNAAKLAEIQEKKLNKNLSNKQRQKLKTAERKLAADQRKRNENTGQAEVEHSVVTNIQALSI